MSFDNLGDRMKDYENVSRITLVKKMPVIIRLDGKAFHSFTRGMERPFDKILMAAMQETCKYLCENVMGCKLAYTQSDEISLLLIDYERQESQQWFSNGLQKMVSVSASMATLAFNKNFRELVEAAAYAGGFFDTEDDYQKYVKKYEKALFDSRAFILPKEEVCNYFIWRQQDASRNSIQMVAQSLFSHKQLNKKNTGELQEMMWREHNINWNDYTVPEKRGICIVKEQYDKDGTTRTRWIADKEIPVFTQDRDYIDKHVFLPK